MAETVVASVVEKDNLGIVRKLPTAESQRSRA